MTPTRLARLTQIHQRCVATLLLAAIFVGCLADVVTAHPLGNRSRYGRVNAHNSSVSCDHWLEAAE